MKAAEWVYLCVAHPAGNGYASGAGGSGGGAASEVGRCEGWAVLKEALIGVCVQGCSAIDYILHT